MPPDPAPSGSSVPLFWRVAAINILVLALATLALVLSPATVSRDLVVREVAVLGLGAVAMIALNLVLLRRAFRPLRRLTRLAREVDPLRPGQRIGVDGGDPEVAALGRACDDMLERLERERRESGLRALRATEGERRRIARELHDEIGQLLTALVLQLEGALRDLRSEERGGVEEARELARGALEEVRDVARRLRPEALDDLGLVAALAQLAGEVPGRAGVAVDPVIVPGLPALSPEEELVVYRVAQEALVNVVRHAEAGRTKLELRADDGRVVLSVRDDGRGFDPAAVPGENGLRGMRERALLVGGRLDVRSAAGRGTAVRLELPGRR